MKIGASEWGDSGRCSTVTTPPGSETPIHRLWTKDSPMFPGTNCPSWSWLTCDTKSLISSKLGCWHTRRSRDNRWLIRGRIDLGSRTGGRPHNCWREIRAMGILPRGNVYHVGFAKVRKLKVGLKTYLLSEGAWLFVATNGRALSGRLCAPRPVEVSVCGWLGLSCSCLGNGPSVVGTEIAAVIMLAGIAVVNSAFEEITCPSFGDPF